MGVGVDRFRALPFEGHGRGMVLFLFFLADPSPGHFVFSTLPFLSSLWSLGRLSHPCPAARVSEWWAGGKGMCSM